MRFIEAVNTDNEIMIINADLISEVIVGNKAGTLNICMSFNDGNQQAYNIIKGTLESFLKAVNITGFIETE